MRLISFTPTRRTVGYTTTADCRKKRNYDNTNTLWPRVQDSSDLEETELANVAARVQGINPSELSRQITIIQKRPLDLALDKPETVDMSIWKRYRLQSTDLQRSSARPTYSL